MEKDEAKKAVRDDAAGEGPARQPLHFAPVCEASAIEHLQLRTLYTLWRRAGLRQEQAVPSRKFIKDRELGRHLPNLLLAELLHADGQFRLLGAGREARRFWALDSAAPASEAMERAELLRTLMRHLSANRLAVGFAGTAMIGGALHSFHLLALPLAEDGYEVDATVVEVAAAEIPAHLAAQFRARTV